MSTSASSSFFSSSTTAASFFPPAGAFATAADAFFEASLSLSAYLKEYSESKVTAAKFLKALASIWGMAGLVM